MTMAYEEYIVDIIIRNGRIIPIIEARAIPS